MGQKKIGVLPAESPRLNERNQTFFNKNERKCSLFSRKKSEKFTQETGVYSDFYFLISKQ
jgi:hypothetical protein